METVLWILVGLVAYVIAYAVLSWFFPVMLQYAWWQILNAMYSFKRYHRERVPKTGAVLIVCNHASYLDWMILWLSVPRPVRFVLWSGYYRNPILRFFLSWIRHRSVRIDNRATSPHAVGEALEAVAKALNAGEVVLMFPEGRLTRNGQMRPFGRGLEMVLQSTTVPVTVIPACTSGLWGSVFSHKGGPIMMKWPEYLRRRVCVWFGSPLPKNTSAAEARAGVAESMADLAIEESKYALLVPRWYVRTSTKWRNMFRPGMVDVSTGTERIVRIGQGLVGAWCLSAWLKRRLGPHNAPNPGGGGIRAVGIWLPTGLGSTLTNIALAFLRIPTVNLNYTASRDANLSACEQAGIKTIITAKRFTAKMPLDLPDSFERIFLEDALGGITKGAKLIRFLAILVLPSWIIERLTGVSKLKPDDLLTIVFSSGSTGEPKGVMLSMRNVSANGHGFDTGVDLRRTDRMLASLPFFHSFGYTVCLWAPAGVGMMAVYYPDPRSAKEIGELCKKHQCTIVLGTATFLRFYLRRCDADDFKSARLIICGAEKLPVKLQDEFEAKFGVRPLEGYGCTELSPVASTNLHDVDIRGVRQIANRHGTVGQPIPGVAAKAFDAETSEPLPHGEEGIIGIKGPNVMIGYLHQPEKTKSVIREGWYLTGDRGLVEHDGFIRITGRMSRFAKIAGEMVPLEKIEEELQDLMQTNERVVVVSAVPDEKRGERIVVLYLDEASSKLDDALKGLASKGLPKLYLPDRRDFHRVDGFPTLGSGKLDLKGVSDLALRTVGL